MMRMSEKRYVLTQVDYGPHLVDLKPEWSELLKESTRPSIYANYDYIFLSIKHFSKEYAKVFFITVRERKNNQLKAIFPMSVEKRDCFNRKAKVLQHCITTNHSDVDKPYPIIHKDHESACWKEFKHYIENRFKDWDWLEYDELIPESALNKQIKKNYTFPKYIAKYKAGPNSPIVNLEGRWDEFERQHRNMRKKAKRIKKYLGERFRYVIYDKEKDMEYCLEQYVATERESWKANRGVSEFSNQQFYGELLPLLAKQGLVFVGILYDGKTPVSTEITFCYLQRVYFALGTYRTDYAKLSPGTVSTSKFIKYFFAKGYKDGDFLAGFADYVNPLADRTEKTKNTVIFKINKLFVYYILMRITNKLKRIFKVAANAS